MPRQTVLSLDLPGTTAWLANARRSLIDTSFRMDVGETVVVGTSRLQGDKALIVLLTAVGGRQGTAGAVAAPNSR